MTSPLKYIHQQTSTSADFVKEKTITWVDTQEHQGGSKAELLGICENRER